MRRVAVMIVTPEIDPQGQARLKAFLQDFEKLRLDRRAQRTIRHTLGRRQRRTDARDRRGNRGAQAGCDRRQRHADGGGAEARDFDVPVVFVGVNEPVVQGFIASMARPAATSPASPRLTFRSSANRWKCSRP